MTLTRSQEVIGKELAKASATGIGKNILTGRMDAFVLLLDDLSEGVQKAALEGINNLGASAEAKNNFRRSGGFPVIVRLFKASCEIQTLTLNAIGYLITRDCKRT